MVFWRAIPEEHVISSQPFISRGRSQAILGILVLSTGTTEMRIVQRLDNVLNSDVGIATRTD